VKISAFIGAFVSGFVLLTAPMAKAWGDEDHHRAPEPLTVGGLAAGGAALLYAFRRARRS
jgi:hypothetical protein